MLQNLFFVLHTAKSYEDFINKYNKIISINHRNIIYLSVCVSADIGGSIGLFIGGSIITVFEAIVFLFYYGRLLVRNVTRKLKRGKTAEVKAMKVYVSEYIEKSNLTKKKIING